MTKLLIVINNWNDGKYLPGLLESIRSQDCCRGIGAHLHDRSEFVVRAADAGSTDDSRHIFAKAGVQVLGCEGLNQPQSVNKFLRCVPSNFFAWINADDLYEPDFVSSHLAAFEDPAIDIVYSDVTMFWDDDRPDRLYKALPLDRFKLGVNPLIHPTTMIRTSLFSEIGVFDETIDYPFDYEFWARAYHAGRKFGYIPRATARWRLRPDSLSNTRGPQILEETARINHTYGVGERR